MRLCMKGCRFTFVERFCITTGLNKRSCRTNILHQSGEKIKFCYLKTPNWMHENVISFVGDFPKELDLEKSVDYELQFNKSFLEPIKTILDCIGWDIERKNTWSLFSHEVCGILKRAKKHNKISTKRLTFLSR